jgi:muramoyltetrapeptide carboxypeptidase LdcA involved in peptidoglycan recycling
MRILTRVWSVGWGPTSTTLAKPNHGQDFEKYNAALLKIAREFGLADLPILSRMDFDHTDPKLILPYGINTELRCDDTRLVINEHGVA